MSVQLVSEKHFSKDTIDAVLKFQNLWRGYRVRRNFISKHTYISAKHYIDHCKSLEDIPKACSGITKVYLPAHLPVVFKALGLQKSKRRFFTMCKARDLCIKNGYKSLWIPAARPYKDYNIKEKLPVHDVRQREQIALYEENQEKFTLAISELTHQSAKFVVHGLLSPTEMNELMNISQMGISKAGGATVIESLMTNTHLLLMHSYPWEEVNASYLMERGLATKYDSTKGLIEQIVECIERHKNNGKTNVSLEDWQANLKLHLESLMDESR